MAPGSRLNGKVKVFSLLSSAWYVEVKVAYRRFKEDQSSIQVYFVGKHSKPECNCWPSKNEKCSTGATTLFKQNYRKNLDNKSLSAMWHETLQKIALIVLCIAFFKF